MKNLQEMSLEEMTKSEGGILPIAIIYGCWAVMGGCCVATAGLYLGYHNTK